MEYLRREPILAVYLACYGVTSMSYLRTCLPASWYIEIEWNKLHAPKGTHIQCILASVELDWAKLSRSQFDPRGLPSSLLARSPGSRYPR